MAGSISTETELDFTKEPVPDRGRMPRFSLTMAWWAVCSAMFWIVVAATLASVHGTRNTIIGLVLTVITYAAVNAPITRFAIRTGLSVSLFSRLLFGRTGSMLAALIFAATAIYYAVFEGSVIAVAATFVWPGLSYTVAALIVVVISVPLVFGSVQNWLDKFNGVLLPIYLLGLLAAVVLAISNYGYSNDWLTLEGSAPSSTGWWQVYVAYMGVWILMMFTFDYARFGRKEDESYHATLNFGAPFYIVTILLAGLAGIFLADTIPVEGALSEVSTVKAIIVMMGLFGMLFVWVTQTRINTANYYLAAVNLEAFGRLALKLDLSKMVWAVIVGAIVFVLMLFDVFGYLLTALAYQGVFVVAWVGVALAYMLKYGAEHANGVGRTDDASYPAYNASGLVAWFASVLIGIVAMQIPEIASFSAPLTAVASFAIYWLSGRPVAAAVTA